MTYRESIARIREAETWALEHELRALVIRRAAGHAGSAREIETLLGADARLTASVSRGEWHVHIASRLHHDDYAEASGEDLVETIHAALRALALWHDVRAAKRREDARERIGFFIEDAA